MSYGFLMDKDPLTIESYSSIANSSPTFPVKQQVLPFGPSLNYLELASKFGQDLLTIIAHKR